MTWRYVMNRSLTWIFIALIISILPINCSFASDTVLPDFIWQCHIDHAEKYGTAHASAKPIAWGTGLYVANNSETLFYFFASTDEHAYLQLKISAFFTFAQWKQTKVKVEWADDIWGINPFDPFTRVTTTIQMLNLQDTGYVLAIDRAVTDLNDLPFFKDITVTEYDILTTPWCSWEADRWGDVIVDDKQCTINFDFTSLDNDLRCRIHFQEKSMYSAFDCIECQQIVEELQPIFSYRPYRMKSEYFFDFVNFEKFEGDSTSFIRTIDSIMKGVVDQGRITDVVSR